jgi:hypothetical protein
MIDVYFNRFYPGFRVIRTNYAYYITVWRLQINIRRHKWPTSRISQ